MKEKIEHEWYSPKKLKRNDNLEQHLKGGNQQMDFVEWDDDMRMDDKVEYGSSSYIKAGDGYVVKGKLVDAFGRIPG